MNSFIWIDPFTNNLSRNSWIYYPSVHIIYIDLRYLSVLKNFSSHKALHAYLFYIWYLCLCLCLSHCLESCALIGSDWDQGSGEFPNNLEVVKRKSVRSIGYSFPVQQFKWANCMPMGVLTGSGWANHSIVVGFTIHVCRPTVCLLKSAVCCLLSKIR